MGKDRAVSIASVGAAYAALGALFLGLFSFLTSQTDAAWLKVTLISLSVMAVAWTVGSFVALIMCNSSSCTDLGALFSYKRWSQIYRRLLLSPMLRAPARWPRDWRMYDWALRLALAYPLLLCVLVWAQNRQSISLADRILLPEPIDLFDTAFVFLAVSVLVVTTLLLRANAPQTALAFASAVFRSELANHASGFAEGTLVTIGSFLISILVGVLSALLFTVMGAPHFDLEFLATLNFIAACAGIVTVATLLPSNTTGASTALGACLLAVSGFSPLPFLVAIVLAGSKTAALVAASVMVCGFISATNLYAGAAINADVFTMIVVFFLIGAAIKALVDRQLGGVAYVIVSLAATAVIIRFVTQTEYRPDLGDFFITSFLDGLLAFSLLLLFPLLNAIFDYFSLIVTFTLLRCGLIWPRWAVVFGIVDLALAFVFFAISGAGIVLALSAINLLSGVELYPIRAVLADIGAELSGTGTTVSKYWWVYLMLFSTIVPTLLHFAIALFSIGAWLTPGLRRFIHANIGATDAAPAIGIPLLIGAYWTACLALPVLVLWGLWHVATRIFFPYPFAWYLDWMQRVSDWAHALLVPLA